MRRKQEKNSSLISIVIGRVIGNKNAIEILHKSFLLLNNSSAIRQERIEVNPPKAAAIGSAVFVVAAAVVLAI